MQQQSWHPLTAEYCPRRSAWLILLARYGEDGWEYAQRVEEPETMLASARGETA